MLGLVSKYWRWRSGADLPFEVFKTVEGVTIHKFKGKVGEKVYAAVKRYPLHRAFHYHDFVSGRHAWSMHDDYFCDCVVSLETIEKKFGKVLLPDKPATAVCNAD